MIRAGGKGCFGIFFFFIFGYFHFGEFIGRGFLFLMSLAAAGFVEFLRRMRRPSYLPALVSVEGGGIRRGLTAPEAAVLLEIPANQDHYAHFVWTYEKRIHSPKGKRSARV